MQGENRRGKIFLRYLKGLQKLNLKKNTSRVTWRLAWITAWMCKYSFKEWFPLSRLKRRNSVVWVELRLCSTAEQCWRVWVWRRDCVCSYTLLCFCISCRDTHLCFVSFISCQVWYIRHCLKEEGPPWPLNTPWNLKLPWSLNLIYRFSCVTNQIFMTLSSLLDSSPSLDS